MEKCYDAALVSCEALNWKRIKCYNGDEIRTIDDIADEIYRKVLEL